MQIRTHADYPATPAEVFAVIADPAFVAHKAEHMSVAAHSAQVLQDGDRTVIRTTRTLPTDEMPDIARKVVGKVLTLSEEQNWGPAAPDGSREGSLHLRVEGAPVSLRGTMRLAPNGGAAQSATIQDIVADLTAKVPLMGSAIEKAAAPAISAGINVEADLVREWLAR